MDGKPIHYDGSIQTNSNSSKDPIPNEPFILTEEMRGNISGNPYEYEIN